MLRHFTCNRITNLFDLKHVPSLSLAMEAPVSSYKKNISANFFFKICTFTYLMGFPRFWKADPMFSKTFTVIFDYLTKFVNFAIYVFIISEWGAMLTQSNLSEKQKSDRLVFCLSHPILCSYRLFLSYHEDELKLLVHTLCVDLKEKVNYEEIEKAMIKKALLYLTSLITLCSLSVILYGVDGYYQSMTSDATFTTVIPVWPDTDDKRSAANAARGFYYFLWWLFMTRIFGAYTMLITLSVALEHQYKILGKYFRDLSEIFNRDLSQAQKEKMYNESVKIGINLHSTTIRCFKLTQDSFSTLFGVQILLNTYVLVLVMSQMVNSERTLGNVFATVATGVSMLLSTGCLMWTGGDITVEAASLPMDMYWSGWHNCHASGTATRKLLALAMLQGQRPVIIKGLGVIKISYSAYLSIVKSAYSVFSVLY